MSQEKVTKYKEQKANRKEIMKKEKRNRMLRNTIAAVICVAAVGWVGYSAVATYIDNIPRDEVEVDYDAFTQYANGLSAE